MVIFATAQLAGRGETVQRIEMIVPLSLVKMEPNAQYELSTEC